MPQCHGEPHGRGGRGEGDDQTDVLETSSGYTVENESLNLRARLEAGRFGNNSKEDLGGGTFRWISFYTVFFKRAFGEFSFLD